VIAAHPPAAASEEEDLFRQVKVAVFDQDWPAVLSGCDAILARFPAGASSPRAAFYRAVALSHLPGRETEALAAYRKFVARHPGETVLLEEAWSGMFSLACGGRGGARAECAPLLKEGLARRSDYVSTLAAIRASDQKDDQLRRAALAVLKKAHDRESDPEIRNQVLIAILKIDPKQVPPPEPRGSPPPGRAATGKAPTLIRMTVFNKAEGRYEVKVNLPVAFARMLVDALGEDQKHDLRQGARAQGIDVDHIFEAIQKAGAGRLLEVESPESRIEIWIE
jgi:hypothetical protein